MQRHISGCSIHTCRPKKFDPDRKYIRKWVPEFDSLDYPPPMVDHDMARDRCLKTYKVALDAVK